MMKCEFSLLVLYNSTCGYGSLLDQDNSETKELILMSDYTEDHARSGIDAELPPIEVWPNQFSGYEITIEMPEFTSICPKTKLPDFGKVTIHYLPDKVCLELKALKYYILGYRNLGIFYENAINRILRDVVAACNPVWATVRGEFTVRGGMKSTIEARHPAKK